MLDDRQHHAQDLAETNALLARLDAQEQSWKRADALGTIWHYHRTVLGWDPDAQAPLRMLHYLMAEHGVSCSDFTPDGDFHIELAEKLRGLLAPGTASGAAGPEQPDIPSQARDRFCYERLKADVQDKEVLAQVNKAPEWGHLKPWKTTQSVRDGADRHAKRFGLPPVRKRKRGSI